MTKQVKPVNEPTPLIRCRCYSHILRNRHPLACLQEGIVRGGKCTDSSPSKRRESGDLNRNSVQIHAHKYSHRMSSKFVLILRRAAPPVRNCVIKSSEPISANLYVSLINRPQAAASLPSVPRCFLPLFPPNLMREFCSFIL